MGLVAAGGRLADGLHAPATLAPGEIAAIAFRGLPPFASPGPVQLAARVEGRMQLAGPAEARAPEGWEQFWLFAGLQGSIREA